MYVLHFVVSDSRRGRSLPSFPIHAGGPSDWMASKTEIQFFILSIITFGLPFLFNGLEVTESEGHPSFVESSGMITLLTVCCRERWCQRERICHQRDWMKSIHFHKSELKFQMENGFKKEFNWGKNQKSFSWVHLVHFTSTWENWMDLLRWRNERIYQSNEWHPTQIKMQ